MNIRQLDEIEAVAAVPVLAEILLDCIAGGASVSFMDDTSCAEAVAFWQSVAAIVARGERILLVAEDDEGHMVGTVQVIVAMPPNQPHRGEIAKMLVHRDGRRQGVGAALMLAAETAGRGAGKTLLTLDTVTDGEACRLYLRLGWEMAGSIPGFALWPDGRTCSTAFMWKVVG